MQNKLGSFPRQLNEWFKIQIKKPRGDRGQKKKARCKTPTLHHSNSTWIKDLNVKKEKRKNKLGEFFLLILQSRKAKI